MSAETKLYFLEEGYKSLTLHVCCGALSAILENIKARKPEQLKEWLEIILSKDKRPEIQERAKTLLKELDEFSKSG